MVMTPTGIRNTLEARRIKPCNSGWKSHENPSDTDVAIGSGSCQLGQGLAVCAFALFLYAICLVVIVMFWPCGLCLITVGVVEFACKCSAIDLL